MAFTAATRANTHLAADALARHYSERTRRLARAAWRASRAAALGAFVVIGGASLVMQSLRTIEAFPDTYNPGYFFIKLALWLLAPASCSRQAADRHRAAAMRSERCLNSASCCSLLVGLGIVFTGLPAAVVLIGVASAGAAFSVVAGAVPITLLSALPGRLVNLFENDLLQALPLYVLMGLLLDRLPVAEALYRTCLRSCRAGPPRSSCPARCSARCSGR